MIKLSKQIKYLLSVDEDIWAQFKAACALGKITIKDALAQMIQKFIKKGEINEKNS